MKKILTLVLALALVMGCFAAVAEGKLYISVISKGEQHAFWQQVRKGCEDAAAEYGVLLIPRMELTTMEEVHAVCLFRTLESALDFDSYVYSHLMKVPNKEQYFGRQLLYDAEDHIIGTEPNLLINATDIEFDAVWDLTKSYNGVMFPAHLDKTTTSLLSNLGFIPPESKFVTAEIKDLKNLHRLRAEHPYLESCRIISDSDAHHLEHMREPDLTLAVEEKSIDCIIDLLGTRP